MKLVRNLSLAFAVTTGALSLSACAGSVEQPQSTASAATKAPVGAGTHGMVKTVGEALGEVPLRAEQRTELEKLAAEADARHAGLAEGRKELAAAIAAQVESGAIDRAALQPKIDRIVADFERVRPEDTNALARVHAILDADQRNTFVDALEERFHGRRGDHAGHEGHAGKKGRAGLKQLAAELKLTDEQRTQIKDVLVEARKHGRAEEQAHHAGEAGEHAGRGGKHKHGGKKALEAFRSDRFDVNAAAPGLTALAAKDRVAAGATRMLAAAEKILPILTPEQRKIAADKIRAGELGAFGR